MRTSVLLVLVLAACGGGSGTSDGPGARSDAGLPAFDFRVDHRGQIALTENWGAYVALFDRGFEQPLPTRIATDGECALYRRTNPSCPGGCNAGEVCVADDTCAPGALRASAGDITITGLREAAVFTPSEFGYTGPTLPADMFADDATIHVSAAGDDLAAFTADVGGVAPLITELTGLIELHDGADETIRWTADAGGARIQIALYLGWHGSPWTDLLICETADDGELTIPSALIEQFPYFEGGLFQWPSWISRFRRAWAGDIEVIASHQVTLGVSHAP
jgi:hypothetical protein